MISVTTGSICTDRLYTGQRAIPSLGLMDYHARFYDSYITHFSQPDSLMPGGPQGLDRYSVGNNPINFADSSGHCVGPMVGSMPDDSAGK
jgi:RHS repeat-associated protein